jgi:hypothetical protein
MHQYEYEFISKYLNKDDIFLEWGSGNSTIYFSERVKHLISIEHDIDYYRIIKNITTLHEIKNIDIYHIAAHSPTPNPCRYEQFKDYIEFVKRNNFKFSKVLIDGRARKYCAKSILDMIDENCIVMIHDFNRPDYQKTLKYYNIIEQLTDGQGIVALRKKPKEEIIEDNDYY